MDLRAIRDHLCVARSALGPGHALFDRIKMVERSLTPGDRLWRDDAVSAERELLAISSELEQLPKVVTQPRVDSSTEKTSDAAQAQVAPGVNEAIRQIADAIELL